jgi:hypothetical protein
VRTLVVILILGAAVGGWTGTSFPHITELLGGIFDDVGEIARSFTGGPDDPHGPVVDAATRSQDAQRLQAATDKADQLAQELQRLKK